MLFTAPGHAILVSQKRKSRAVLSYKQPGKAALLAAARLLSWFTTIDPQLRKSITFDNGTEFAPSPPVDSSISKPSSAIPTAPGKRGQSKTPSAACDAFATQNQYHYYRDDLLYACFAAYNATPRKCLGFQTPAEVISWSTVALQM